MGKTVQAIALRKQMREEIAAIRAKYDKIIAALPLATRPADYSKAQEAFGLSVEGYSINEIAERLGVSAYKAQRLVHVHRQSLRYDEGYDERVK